MKILYLSSELIAVSGVSKHLYYLTGELKKSSEIETHIITPGGDYIPNFEKQTDNIKILKQLSFENRTIFNFIYSILFIAAYCLKNKINIIHSHTHYCANIAWYAAKLAKIKTVQTIHGIIPPIGRLPHYKAGLMISLNDQITRDLIINGVSADQITKIASAVPIPPKIEHTCSPLNIICISRLIIEKGVQDFIEAIKIIRESHPEVNNANFFIAGEGIYEPSLKELVQKYDLKINFIGSIEPFTQLTKTNIFVFPSRITTEGFPMVFIEAALCKNLIITTNFDSLEEFFAEDECIKFKMNEPLDLAEKLALCIVNYEKMKDIAEKAYVNAAKNFNISLNTKKLIALYSSII